MLELATDLTKAVEELARRGFVFLQGYRSIILHSGMEH